MCTVLVTLVQWSGMASPGDVSIVPVFVLVLCIYHCTVCTVLVPFVHVCVCDFFPFMLDIKFVEGFRHSFSSSTVKSNFVY